MRSRVELPPAGWDYRRIANDRHKSLFAKTSIEELADEIMHNVEFVPVCRSERCEEAQRKKIKAFRLTFNLTSTRTSSNDDAMDRLLNGAYGIRAHYAASARAGDHATATLVHAIADSLQRELAAWVADPLFQSYSIRSAKVWFPRFVDVAQPDNGTVECAGWNQTRNDPKSIFADLSVPRFAVDDQFIESRLIKGRTVPMLSTLTVKGGFCRGDGRQYIVLNKRSRAKQIHYMGWS